VRIFSWKSIGLTTFYLVRRLPGLIWLRVLNLPLFDDDKRDHHRNERKRIDDAQG
jgi:hypothetical protein